MVIACKQQLRGLTCFGIPHANRAVFASGGERLPVGREHDRADVVGVTPQRFEHAARFYVPEADESIHPPAPEREPVGGKSDGPHPVRMASEGLDFSGAGLPVVEKVNAGWRRSVLRREAGWDTCGRLGRERLAPYHGRASTPLGLGGGRPRGRANSSLRRLYCPP